MFLFHRILTKFELKLWITALSMLLSITEFADDYFRLIVINLSYRSSYREPVTGNQLGTSYQKQSSFNVCYLRER